MKFVNLTPHEIRIRRDVSPVGDLPEPLPDDLVIPSTGAARVDTISGQCLPLDGVPVVRVTYGEIVGLPRLACVHCGQPIDQASPSSAACQALGRCVPPRVMPDVDPDCTIYIVSLLVMQALVARDGVCRADVVGPATGPKDGAVRDAQGRIFAVRALQRL